jgi:hypothetical protein
LLLVSGLGVGLGAFTSGSDGGVVGEVMVATLAFVPAVLVVIGRQCSPLLRKLSLGSSHQEHDDPESLVRGKER